MNDIVDIARAGMNSVASVLFIFLFLNKIFERKYQSRYIYTAAYVFSVIVTWLTTLLNFPAINVIRSVLLINVICMILYKVEIKSAIIYNTIYIMTTVFVDIITISLMGVVWKQSLNEILSDFQQITMSNLLFWICSFLAYKLLVYLIKRNFQDRVHKREIIFLVLITSFELEVVFYITTLTENSTQGIFLTFILLGFLTFNMYFTKLLDSIGKTEQLKRDLALSNQQSIMQLKYYQELIQKNILSRTISHDIRNHLQMLESLYSTGKNKEAQEYSDALNLKIDKLSYGFNCSNLILSIIISHKMQQAEMNGISLELDVEDVSMDFIDDLDITAIFANLLDNAIEACNKLEENTRKIQVVIRQINGFIAVKISNTIKDVPQKNGEIYKTTKKHHEGIGLTNVLNAVKKYNGDFSADIEGDQFVAKVTICTPM